MNVEDMRQCALGRRSTMTIAWIPVDYAKAGMVLDLRQEDGTWSQGWTVGAVYPARLSQDYVREHERDYKSQREASDI